MGLLLTAGRYICPWRWWGVEDVCCALRGSYPGSVPARRGGPRRGERTSGDDGSEARAEPLARCRTRVPTLPFSLEPPSHTRAPTPSAAYLLCTSLHFPSGHAAGGLNRVAGRLTEREAVESSCELI